MNKTAKKTVRLNYNVTPEQLKKLRETARRVGEPLALFVRKAALARCEMPQPGETGWR